MYEKIFGQLNGPRYTVNMRLHLRNMFVFKSIYCSHYQSCFEHMRSGFWKRFVKGVILHLAMKYLLNYLQDMDMEQKRTFIGRFFRIIFSFDPQVLKTGIFAASFGLIFKLLTCV